MATKKSKSQADKIADFLKIAKDRLDWEIKADEHNRKKARECLKFALVPGNQWDAAEKARREADGGFVVEVNLLPKYIAQVVGEMLYNRARISLKPSDSAATPRVANIRRGIIADSEYQSNSEDIYLEAGKMQVAGGYGAWRINTRYKEDDPFLQEIYDELIPNAIDNVYLDSRRKDPAGSDAKYGFILCQMPTDEFKEQWPDAQVPYEILGKKHPNDLWYMKDTTMVAEYFIIDPTEKKMFQLEDGSTCSEEEFKELVKEWEEKQKERDALIQKLAVVASQMPQQSAQMPPQTPPAPGAMPPQGVPNMPQAGALPAPPPIPPPPIPPLEPKPKIVKRRVTKINKVKHYTITATEILRKKKQFDDEEDIDLLEGETFPGEYIPICQVVGPEVNIEGKVWRKGLVHDAMDAQKVVNFWETALATIIGLQPKAPWVGTAEQFEGNEEVFRTANVRNFPFITYKPHIINGQLVPPPQRQGPGEPPIALFQQVAKAHENVKQVMGMYGSDVGEVGPERTGAAVYAKQKPGDISTYVYAYNLTRAIAHSGKIKNSIIPHIYDTERDVRLRNVDDTEVIAPINTTAEAAIKSIKANPAKYGAKSQAHLENILAPYHATARIEGKEARVNDIRKGKYEVIVTAGPSYATQRQETALVLQNMMQAMPREVGKVIDILFENLDFKDADRIASRFRRMMPPGLVNLKEGEVPFKPPAQPQAIALLQKAKTDQAREITQQLKSKVEMLKIAQLTGEKKEAVVDEILRILSQLHAPIGQHPADQFTEMGDMG